MTKTLNPSSKSHALTAVAKTPDEKAAVNYFKEVCLRDGLEMRTELIKLIKNEWTKKHPPPGNPQTQLFQYEEREYRCEWLNCNQEAKFVCKSVFPFGGDRKFCLVHRKRAEFKGEVSSYKKL